MIRTGIVGAIILLTALLLPLTEALAASDGFYSLTEISPAAWDGTDASTTGPRTDDYDYVYGDEQALTFNLPPSWAFSFYGQPYNRITVDTNGNVWFATTEAASSFNLAEAGRGPVIAAWNNDLSSNYYGGAFVQHKTNPERVVIEWRTETYRDQGEYLPSNFEIVIFPNGSIRIDYRTFASSAPDDFGSGVSRGDGGAVLGITANYGPAPTLAGRSFQFTQGQDPRLTVVREDIGFGSVTSEPAGITCGATCSATFAPRSSVTLTAAATTGSVFTGWGGACSGVGSCTVAMDDARSVTASFTPAAAPIVAITSPLAGMNPANPVLKYTADPGTVVVKLDGVVVAKVADDTLGPLAGGLHQIRAEVTNRAGYTGFAESSFSVDALSPAVTATTPLAGAKDVPVDAAITFTVNKPLAPGSLTAETVSLTSALGLVAGSASMSTDGMSVTFTPAAPLGHSRVYTATLKAGMTDQAGNAMPADHSFSFTTRSDSADLVGLWRMDGDWSDASGNGNNGAVNGGVTFATERIAGASSGDFNGTNAFVAIAAADSLSPQVNGRMTVSAWVYLRAYPSGGEYRAPVVAKGVSGSYEYALYVHSDGTAGLTLWQPDGTNHISVQGGRIPLNTWSHIAASYDRNGLDVAVVYLNGVAVARGSYAVGSTANGASPLQIGHRPDNAVGQYLGLIDEVAIYRNALTADEILARYNDSPKVALTSPGQAVSYRPGSTGTATVTVTHPVGADIVNCTASGAASGTLSLPIDPPRPQFTQDFIFQIAADALPNATATIICNGGVTTTGYSGKSILILTVVEGDSPTVISSSVADTAQNVSATMPIIIDFSEAMAPASANSSSVTLASSDGTNQQAPVTITFSADLKNMTVTPLSPLLGNTPYLLTVTTMVTDAVGNRLAQDYPVRFTTSPVADLTVSGQGSSASPYVVAPGRYGAVTIDNSYVICNGWLAADTISLTNGAVLSHAGATTTTTYNLEVSADSMTIDATSKIDVTAKGYLGGGVGDNIGSSFGRTSGNAFGPQQTTYSVGGNYGGLGGPVATNINPLYGSPQSPTDLGSGGTTIANYGSYYPAGNGGGRVKLTSRLLTLNGQILASGGSTTLQYGGGGSGGSVLIRIGELTGNGIISASGGNGANAPGGGGGRVALYYDYIGLPTGNVRASGGLCQPAAPIVKYQGNPGTIYLMPNSMPLTVALDGTGAGAVQSSPAGISCGTTCTSQFPSGSTVALTALADANSVFVGWSGACSVIGKGDCSVPLNAATAITATFAQIPPPVIISPPPGLTNIRDPLLFYSFSEGTTGVTVKVDGMAVNRVSGQTLAALPDGSHTLEVIAHNYSGSSTSAMASFTVDTTSPMIAVAGVADRGAYRSAVTPLVSIADDNLAESSATLNGYPYISGTELAAEGLYSLEISAVDLAGNAVRHAIGFAIDMTPPASSVAIGMPQHTAIDAVTVSSRTPLVVNAQDLGSVQTGVVGIECSVDGDQTWRVNDTNRIFSGLVDGTHSVSCRAVDKAGNRESVPHTLTVSVDSMSPATSVAPSGGVYNEVQSVVLSASEPAVIHFTTDGSTPTDSSAVYSQPISISADTTLKFFAKDSVDNSSEVKTVSFIIDTVPPLLTLSTLSNGSYTNKEVLNLSGTVVDNSGIKELQLNGATAPFSSNGSFSLPLLLNAGINAVEVTAVDQAGNVSSDRRTIILDQFAPSLTVTEPADNSKTATALLNVAGTVDETSSVEIRLGDIVQTAVMNGTVFSAGVTLVPGGNTIEITATDLARNSSSQKRSVVYDDQKPSLSISQPDQDIRTNQASLLLQGNATDPYTMVTVTIDMDGQTYTPALVEGRFEQLLSFPAEKSYAIIVTAINEAGSFTVAQRNVIYDITQPTLTIDPVATPTGETSQTVSGTRESGLFIEVVCPTATIGQVSYPTDTSWSVVLDGLQSGANTVSVTSVDPAGNSISAAAVITVGLPSAPLFSHALFGNSGVVLAHGGRVAVRSGSGGDDDDERHEDDRDKNDHRRQGGHEQAAAAVGTNSAQLCAIRLENGARIDGRVEVGYGGDPATAICLEHGAAIRPHDGGNLAAPKPMTPQSDPGGGKPLGSIQVKKKENRVLSAGEYRCNSLELKHGGRLTLHGKVSLHVDGDVAIGAGSKLEVNGSTVIYLNGRRLDLAHGAIVNRTGEPGNLVLYGTAALRTVRLAGSSELRLLLHAPTAAVTIDNGQTIYGAIIADSIGLESGSAIYFDRGWRQEGN